MSWYLQKLKTREELKQKLHSKNVRLLLQPTTRLLATRTNKLKQNEQNKSVDVVERMEKLKSQNQSTRNEEKWTHSNVQASGLEELQQHQKAK